MQRAHEVYGHLEHTRYVQQPANLGKGAALRLGISLANGANVITADADMAIDPSTVPAVHDSPCVIMNSCRDRERSPDESTTTRSCAR